MFEKITKLGHGSMLLMKSQTQKICFHSIKKDEKVVEPRISFTFRALKTKMPTEKNEIMNNLHSNQKSTASKTINEQDGQRDEIKEIWQIIKELKQKLTVTNISNKKKEIVKLETENYMYILTC